MLLELLKSLLVGILVAAPVGPVLFFVIQKTMCDSRRAGLYSGLGSAFADATYAAIGVFALGLVRDFIDKNTPIIMLIGGLLVAGVGFNMIRSKIADPIGNSKEPAAQKPWIWYSSQTALCAFSNPTALFVAMGLLALFKLDSASLTGPAWAVIPCVFIGEMCWWTFVTFAITKFIHPSAKVLGLINRIAGAVVIALGIYLAVRGLITLLQ